MKEPADIILDAVESRRSIGLLSDGDSSLDEDGAYAIASAVHARRLERGERPVGRKIGFTNRTIWAEYGVWAPIWSHVYDSTVHYTTDGASRLAMTGTGPRPCRATSNRAAISCCRSWCGCARRPA